MKPNQRFDNLISKSILDMNTQNMFMNQENREEIIKIMMQTLEQMGFEKTVEKMMDEIEMKKFKQLIQSSQWQNAIDYSSQLPFQDDKSENLCKFLIYRHWYFESLLKQKTDQALTLLRNQLKPLTSQIELSTLASLVAYTEQKELLNKINQIIYSNEGIQFEKKKQENNKTENLCSSTTCEKVSKSSGLFGQKQIQNIHQQSNHSSLSNYSFQDTYTFLIHSIWDLIKERKSIPPVNRLNSIVKQAKSYQILKCPVHASLPNDYSILENHFCKAKGYPNILASQHKEHEDEVWHVQFSPNGLYAASICKKSSICIWRIVKKKLQPKNTSNQIVPMKKKGKKLSSKSSSTQLNEKTSASQSEHQLIQQTTDSSILNHSNSLETSNNSILGSSESQKKKSQLQNSTHTKTNKYKGKDKKLSKKCINISNRRRGSSRIELELVVKKNLDDTSTVQCFSWNQKSNLIVTSQNNKVITVWKINTEGKPSIERVKHIEQLVEPKSILFLPEKNDKSVIIYTSDDEYIYMWDYSTDSIPKIQCDYDNQSIHLHPNNQDLISVCNQGRISLINLSKKQEVGFFIEKNQIINANLSSSGSHILLSVLGKENSIHMWNITENELESVFTGFKQTDCLLRASMKDEYVSIGDEDGKIFIWHKNIPQKPICVIYNENINSIKIQQFPLEENGNVEPITDIFNTTNKKIRIENQNLKEEPLNVQTQEPMNEENKKTINQVHFNPVFPGMLIVAGDDNTVRLFVSDDINYKIPEKSVEKKKQSTMEQLKQKVQSLIPCFDNKSTSKKRNQQNKNSSQIMEEEGDSEELSQNKRITRRSDSNKIQDQGCGLECEGEGDLLEEEDDDEEVDEDQQDVEEEDDEESDDASEEQKLEQEEGESSSNILAGIDSNQQNNPSV